ncbi:hypothetical protein VAA_04040 [Vibrio anguillarum 775]|nr:hypothetical protein VAA_04040 [Vibrio anguillarum 775]
MSEMKNMGLVFLWKDDQGSALNVLSKSILA